MLGCLAPKYGLYDTEEWGWSRVTCGPSNFASYSFNIHNLYMSYMIYVYIKTYVFTYISMSQYESITVTKLPPSFWRTNFNGFWIRLFFCSLLSAYLGPRQLSTWS